MKKHLLFLLLFFGTMVTTLAQGYIEHKVADGETLMQIVQRYKVSPYELYELNPDAKDGVTPGMMLIFLRTKNYPYDPTLVDVKKHKVRKKETLFGIASSYSLDEETLKKYNPKLYSKALRRGKVLRIPVFDESLKDQMSTVSITTEQLETTSGQTHTVQPKEGKWGIARKYGLTIEALEALNPHIKDGLKIGQVLNVSAPSVNTITVNETVESTTDDPYDYYEVQPKEGFYRLTKKLGVSKDSLLSLNPELRDGIKLGMKLRYPKKEQDKLNFDLKDSLVNAIPRNITLLLPLRLNKIIGDSTSNVKDLVRQDRYVNGALDFYSGAMIAVDSVKQLGVSTRLNIIDTEYSKDQQANVTTINRILNRSFEENEVIIGPLVPSNVYVTTTALKGKNIPLIVPFPVRQNKTGYPHLYQTAASEQQQEEAMLEFIDEYKLDKVVVIVTDDKLKSKREQLKQRYPSAKIVTPREGNLLIKKDFAGILSEEKENIIIAEASSVGLAATLTSVLNTLTNDHKITLFTATSKRRFDDKSISNRSKANLNLHVVSRTKPAVFELENVFVAHYKKEYGKLPNTYALRGFDLTMDVLLRSGVIDQFEDAAMKIGETSYIENKFNYIKAVSGGYINKGVYILKYTPELTLEDAQLIITPESIEE